MIRLGTFLIVCLLLASPARAAPPAFAVGEVRVLTLNAGGEAVITVKPGRLAVLEADVFAAPDTTGDIVLEVLGKDGLPLPSGVAAGPGPVTARIRAAHPGAATIQIRIRADPSVDGYEPNDDKAHARPVTLPFDGWIEIRPGDQDWFRVDAPSEGVVGVSLNPVPTGRLRFVDEAGKVIQETAEDSYIAGGITYAAARGRRLYVVIEGAKSGERQVSRLTISSYATPGGSDGALVTVDIADQDETVDQLNLAARAAGASTLSANDAVAIDSALTDTLAAPKGISAEPSWTVALVAGLLALLAIAGGVAYRRWVRRPRAAKDPPPND